MAEQSIPIPGQRRLKERASDEFKRFIVIFLYLWVVFGLLSIHKSFVLSQVHLNYTEHAFAIINAFVFAKVLLVAEHFNLGTRFSDKILRRDTRQNESAKPQVFALRTEPLRM